MPGSYGSAPKGAGHLSCFLRDQLYPGIRKQKRQKAGKSLDVEMLFFPEKILFVRARGILDVSELYAGEKNYLSFAKVITSGKKDPILLFALSAKNL